MHIINNQDRYIFSFILNCFGKKMNININKLNIYMYLDNFIIRRCMDVIDVIFNLSHSLSFDYLTLSNP